ncbi:MAG: ATP-binding protein, partial [Planctomycetota bacterium]
MTAKQQVVLSWSSGKDSATALAALQADPTVELRGLFTTLNGEADRVAMHAVRRTLLRAQAEAAGLPLFEVDLLSPCTNDEYLARVRDAVHNVVHRQFGSAQSADLQLRDLNFELAAKTGSGDYHLTPALQDDPSAKLPRGMASMRKHTWLAG